MTVREPRLPAEDEGVPRSARQVESAAALLQLGAQLDRYPDELPAASASAWGAPSCGNRWPS
jgi:hypothetical protein